MAKQPKTPAEIVARIKAVQADDWMGTQINDLIVYLPFADAQQFLKPEAKAEEWEQLDADPMKSVKEYLSFAWEKANNCRGLSAGRSIDHLKSWLWLAGYGALVQSHFQDYERYGKKQLVIASVLSGFDWRSHDNGEWVNSEDGPSLSEEEIQNEAEDAQRIAAEYA